MLELLFVGCPDNLSCLFAGSVQSDGGILFVELLGDGGCAGIWASIEMNGLIWRCDCCSAVDRLDSLP